MAIGIGIGLPFRRNITTTPAVPTGLSASFTVDTISGDLTWTDNSGGKAQYEVYSSTNSGAYVLLGTTVAGATSYSDTSCKQNASVVYKIRAKYYSLYSEYVTATAVVTPLCWKTDQSTLTTVTINGLTISSGTVNINWGDGTNNNYTGANTNIVKNYSTTGQFNISMSGDLNNITVFQHYNQSKSYGSISNWIFYPSISYTVYNDALTGDISQYDLSRAGSGYLLYNNTELTGDLTNNSIKNTCTNFRLYGTKIYGKAPNLLSGSSTLTTYQLQSCYLSGTNITNFGTPLTNLDLSGQKVLFPTSEVDKFFKAAADWYQVNTPTANCTFNLSGANMGIPTGGITNTDIVRLTGYYTTAGKSATIICRTS